MKRRGFLGVLAALAGGALGTRAVSKTARTGSIPVLPADHPVVVTAIDRHAGTLTLAGVSYASDDYLFLRGDHPAFGAGIDAWLPEAGDTWMRDHRGPK